MDVQQLVERAVLGIELKVHAALHNAGVDPSVIPDLHEVFADESLLNPFAGIQTEHLQMKYFKENFEYLVS